MQAAWMVAASLFFALMSVCIKFASPYFGPLEIVCYRGAIGVLFMWALCRSRGVRLHTSVPMMHVWRNVVGVSALVCWFYAIAHLPLATNGAGEKLSKQTLAQAVDGLAPGGVVADALRFLGHPPPAALGGAAPAELLAWAQGIWSLARVPCVRGAPMPGYG